MNSLLLTSGYNFEGYRIKEYLGFCTGESAMGTGFLSSWGAKFADYSGGNSILYSKKLNQAKNIALKNLERTAASLEANAIIGVTVSFTAFSNDIMGVICNGTAVKIEKIPETPEDAEKKESLTNLHVYNYNPSIPIRPVKVLLRVKGSAVSCALSMEDINENTVTHLDTDLIFKNLFGDTIECKHIYFGNFQQNGRRRTSDFVSVPIPPEELPLKSVKVKIKRYIDHETVIIPQNVEVVGDFADESGTSESNEGRGDSEAKNRACGIAEFLKAIESFHSAKEIQDYALEFNDVHDEVIDSKIMKFIESQVRIERLYGGKPADYVAAIRELLEKNNPANDG